MKKIGVGVVGCGNISKIYFENLTKRFENTYVAAVCDLVPEKAQKAADEYGIKKVLSLEELLNDAEVEIVLNITTPIGHYDICKKALLAGKHTYVEKPLSLTFEDGKQLVELAKEKKLMLGCAPDTFMGGGIQTCRKIIDNDEIGKPIGAVAFMLCPGHESWHPEPEFYYKIGGGPMFDMGPYYLTALVNLLGNVVEVTSMNTSALEYRTITSQPKNGQKIKVEVPTHTSGLIRFENGATATIITSFDVLSSALPNIEIYGSKGSIKVPDPNTFGESGVKISLEKGNNFVDIPLSHIYEKNSRGIGVADMARAIIENKFDNRASGEVALHVLEIMSAMFESDITKTHYKMKTKINRTALMSCENVEGKII